MPYLSIIIKCLNEENNLAGCISSALAATADIDTEIIIVDSLSTDGTVRIATSFSHVKLIQFTSSNDCGCGAAVQLGYQYSSGKFLYLLDGDMKMNASFLRTALQTLESNERLAGVSGRLIDTRNLTIDDQRRITISECQTSPAFVEDLPGGGLYKRSAIYSVGYIAHRGLKACEEAELGARLKAAGWLLVRLNEVAVFHTGHNETDLQTLRRKWRNRRLHAYGMLMRDAMFQPWGRIVAQRIRFVFYLPLLLLSTLACWIVAENLGLLSSFGETSFLAAYASTSAAAVLVIAILRKNLWRGLYSVISWHVYWVAFLIGFFQKLDNPLRKIDYRVLK